MGVAGGAHTGCRPAEYNKCSEVCKYGRVRFTRTSWEGAVLWRS